MSEKRKDNKLSQSKVGQSYQCALPCTTCGKPVEYHCNTCGDALCSRCRQMHLKSNAGKHHKVVPYVERSFVNKAHLPCKTHTDQPTTAWCNNCNKPICGECAISPAHRGHDFLKIETKIDERREMFQYRLKNISGMVTEWKTSLSESRELEEGFRNDVQRLDKEIEHRAEQICNEVKEIGDVERKQLKHMTDMSHEGFKVNEKIHQDSIEEMERQAKYLEDRLQSNNPSCLLEMFEEDLQNFKPPECIPPSLPVFTPGNLDVQAVREMFGHLTAQTETGSDVIDPQESLPSPILIPELQVESTIKVDKGLLSRHTPSIVCIGPGYAWIRYDRRKLQLMDRQATVMKTVNINFLVSDLATTNGSDVLLADHENRCVKSLTIDDKIDIRFKTEWKPQSLSCLPNDEVVVAFREAGRLIWYNSKGIVVKEMGTSLIQYPWYVTFNHVNQLLYVCDKSHPSLEDAPGKLLAFEMNGTLLYTYEGSGIKEFTPLGMCTDHFGHVLITDIINERIHVLDKSGRFIDYLTTRDDVLKPETVDVDVEGFVWIGESNTGKVKVAKYMYMTK